jgi:3-oxoacyl-[acyl-carrier-protein] synthase II
VIIGSGIGGISTFEEQTRVMVERGPKRISPFFVPMFIPDIAAGHVSMRYGMRGPNYCTVSACASSAHAVGDAFRIIERGEADIMVAGGTEATVTPLTIAGIRQHEGAVDAQRLAGDGEPAVRCDAGRLRAGRGRGRAGARGAGACAARGAEILGELVGFRPERGRVPPDGARAGGCRCAARDAPGAADAGLETTDVGYINAHGTSTPMNDLNETLAVKAVFGDHAHDLVMGSTKSMTGHLLGAAGGVEAVISTLVCREGRIPPTINFRRRTRRAT